MTDSPAVIVDGLKRLDLDQVQVAVYDRPIGMRLLYQDPKSGAEHYLVRYPAGLAAQRHRHTAAHTIIVLEGRLDVNGEGVGPGAYCHFPGGQAMHHTSTGQEPCLFVIMFDGPFDVDAVEG
jgi:quercetin dioxygenase-like cupin family protein